MSLTRLLLLIVSSVMLMLGSTCADEKPDPPIQALIDYFAKNGIKMEKAREWGWHVVDPKLEGYYVLVNLKSFPSQATEKEMRKALEPISLAHMLNAPARLAMSYPCLSADAPGKPKYKAPDIEKLPIYARMIKLFMDYRPAEKK